MPGNGVREARGIVVLAQEDRFRLQTREGRSFLFVLGGGGAAVSLDRLEAMAGSGRVIRVHYRGEPEAGAVALAIQPG
jgi:hypothetical protein